MVNNKSYTARDWEMCSYECAYFRHGKCLVGYGEPPRKRMQRCFEWNCPGNPRTYRRPYPAIMVADNYKKRHEREGTEMDETMYNTFLEIQNLEIERYNQQMEQFNRTGKFEG